MISSAIRKLAIDITQVCGVRLQYVCYLFIIIMRRRIKNSKLNTMPTGVDRYIYAPLRCLFIYSFLGLARFCLLIMHVYYAQSMAIIGITTFFFLLSSRAYMMRTRAVRWGEAE